MSELISVGGHEIIIGSGSIVYRDIIFYFQSSELRCKKDNLIFAFGKRNNQFCARIDLHVRANLQGFSDSIALIPLLNVSEEKIAFNGIYDIDFVSNIIEDFCVKFHSLKSEFKESLLNKTSD